VSGPVRDHRDLRVWQLAIDLALMAYDLSAGFPQAEVYGLAIQMRRAAVSVASNIAEGNGRVHRAEYAHFLSMARGSLREVQTLTVIARRREYISDEELSQVEELLDHIGRMFTRLLKRLNPS
jgi:four helix bundle protein